MRERIESVRTAIENFEIKNPKQLEDFRIRFVGRKGLVAELFGELKHVRPEERKAVGQELNTLKDLAEGKFRTLQESLRNLPEAEEATIDLTLPPVPDTLGAVHPLTLIRARITQIFERLGFNISEGPEIEDDRHNFTALNFPENHPARDMQDTFFIAGEKDMALRTHTSSVQVRVMESQKPPVRTLSPGRVYRNEAVSARAHCIFHQVEGLYIDENVSFKDLKQTLFHFVKEMFGESTKIRFRPSYFPFTEPSAEIDISCLLCGGKGCNVCKYTGWVEIAGAGMVDPQVFINCGIDPEKYTGFAFGMGIERIAMLKYDIGDLRLFTKNDVRFLKQFRGIL